MRELACGLTAVAFLLAGCGGSSPDPVDRSFAKATLAGDQLQLARHVNNGADSFALESDTQALLDDLDANGKNLTDEDVRAAIDEALDIVRDYCPGCTSKLEDARP